MKKGDLRYKQRFEYVCDGRTELGWMVVRGGQVRLDTPRGSTVRANINPATDIDSFAGQLIWEIPGAGSFKIAGAQIFDE
jgi:hypothetical protein